MSAHRIASASPLGLAAAMVVGLCACGGSPRMVLEYKLAGGLLPSDVVRVETQISVAPGDPHNFTADSPYRSVGNGVGYEVGEFDGDTYRSVLITHDSTIGYVFETSFSFTLLPPDGDVPALSIEARAFGTGLSDVFADTGAVPAAFDGRNTVKLTLVDLRCGGATLCANGEVCCGDQCTNTTTDDANCGACGTACTGSGESCSGSECRCNGGGSCASGSTCCASLGCIDTQNDVANCGGCGLACPIGSTCSAGKCGCGSTTCTDSQVCCDGTCTTGGCVCGATTCTETAPVCCGDTCSDLSDDDANCGKCGESCTAPLHCKKGSCQCNGAGVCSGGDTCCAGGCKTLSDDPQNCGGCGMPCATGETCSAGKCVCGTSPACGAGQACCGSGVNLACANLQVDENNCGQCGAQCSGTDVCTNGQCLCSGTNQQCTGDDTCCPNLGCFDLAMDNQHCGGCNNACKDGQGCSGGQCVAVIGQACMPSCVNGTTCKDGECYCGNTQTACNGNGQVCCASGQCVDEFTDVNNCGGCGRICTGTNPLCCGGTCTDGTTTMNCGACATACGALQACVKCGSTYMCQGLGICPL